MSVIEQAKQFRNDFMQAPGKGNSRDALTRQTPGLRRVLTNQDLTRLYADNRIIQNVIDIPAEDMTRSWFTLRMKDENLQRDIMSKLADLNAREAFKKMRSYERLRGDGFISLGVAQKNPFELSDPIREKELMRIDYIHAFSGMKVYEFLLNEDMFHPKYGQVESFQLNRRSRVGQEIAGPTQDRVHASRVIHDQTRRLEDEYRGQPLLEPLYDIITVLDTSLWSVGQMLYDFTFKVYKSTDIEGMGKEDKRELSTLMDFMFRTEALALIGKDEELTKQSTVTTGIKDLLDYVWDMLAGAARMPKTVIKGQEAGTIAGAQYDVMNYYSRIAAQQENELKPHIERLIRLLLLCSDELGGTINPDSVEWEIKFNPLWNVDSKTDAEIRKLTAETDNIYIVNGVHTPDEVREARFGQFGLTNETKYSGDDADWERMAKEVYTAYKESQ
ncbi:anti-CBASS protein Acb1 family protein [Priestia megaterium]|uniref:anti-CBASS protein Acb1 family protein n=1 Tax=Priestia megaterium TaxID=1404 RepID=UPI001F5F1C76|nr:anti-CBASS Acb1 family protein [Priestia megaterium]